MAKTTTTSKQARYCVRFLVTSLTLTSFAWSKDWHEMQFVRKGLRAGGVRGRRVLLARHLIDRSWPRGRSRNLACFTLIKTLGDNPRQQSPRSGQISSGTAWSQPRLKKELSKSPVFRLVDTLWIFHVHQGCGVQCPRPALVRNRVYLVKGDFIFFRSWLRLAYFDAFIHSPVRSFIYPFIHSFRIHVC